MLIIKWTDFVHEFQCQVSMAFKPRKMSEFVLWKEAMFFDDERYCIQ